MTWVKSQKSLEVIQERMDKIDMRIRGHHNFLSLIKEARGFLRERISALMGNDELVTVGKVAFDELTICPSGSPCYGYTGEGGSTTRATDI